MTRISFEEELKILETSLLSMGSVVEASIDKAMKALVTKDVQLADQVLKGDDEIDAFDLHIELDCIRLLALQQPMAKDLRTITSVLKIAGDLERIGDHAADIAKITQKIAPFPKQKEIYAEIIAMSDLVKKVLKEALDSYVRRDEPMAQQVCAADDEIDSAFRILFDKLSGIMVESKSAETTQENIQLLFVIRYLERIGDHVNNIGERVIYLVTGELKDMNA